MLWLQAEGLRSDMLACLGSALRSDGERTFAQAHEQFGRARRAVQLANDRMAAQAIRTRTQMFVPKVDDWVWLSVKHVSL